MRTIVAMMALAFIAACGANGEPVRPTMNAGLTVSPTGQKTSISVSGEARFGVTWSN